MPSSAILTRSFGLALATNDLPWAAQLLKQGADPEACKAAALKHDAPGPAMALLDAAGARWRSEDFLIDESWSDHQGVRHASYRLPSDKALQELLNRGLAPSGVVVELAAGPGTGSAVFARLAQASSERPAVALADACRFGSEAKIAALIQLGWDAEAKDDGRSPLEWCFSETHDEPAALDACARLLVEAMERPVSRAIRANNQQGYFSMSPAAEPNELGLAKVVIRLGLPETAAALLKKWRGAADGSYAFVARAALMKAKKQFPQAIERELLLKSVPAALSKRSPTL